MNRWLTLALLATLFGFIFAQFSVPASWLIGPMLAGLIVSLRDYRPGYLPQWPNLGAQAIIGVAVSASFTPTTLSTLARNWPVIGIAVLSMLVFSLLGAFILVRWGNFDPATALLGTLPGGAPGMVAMSDALNADARYVAVMQFVRVMMLAVSTALISRWLLPIHKVISPASFAPLALGWTPLVLSVLIGAIGAWIGIKTNLPAGAIALPALLGAVAGMLGYAHGTWPPGILPLAYAILGIYVGMRFDVAAMRHISRAIPAMLGNLVFLMLSTGCVGALLGWLSGVGAVNGYLAAAPGGLDTVSSIALAVGADISLVFTSGLIRFFTIVLLGPVLVRGLLRICHSDPT